MVIQIYLILLIPKFSEKYAKWKFSAKSTSTVQLFLTQYQGRIQKLSLGANSRMGRGIPASQLGCLRERRELLSRVQGGAPTETEFCKI